MFDEERFTIPFTIGSKMRHGKDNLRFRSKRRRPPDQRGRRRRPRGARQEANSAQALEAQPRLQKVLAAAGFGSRRDCEQLILEGRVEVDRNVVAELGTRVDLDQHEIRVDGQILKRPRKVYYAVHKPQDVITTNEDPAGRMRVVDLVPDQPRVFPVGRLDVSSEGLIVVTNDGALANRLTHPRYRVEKLYHVLVAGTMDEEELNPLRQGVHLAEGLARAARVQIRSHAGHSTWLEMVLDEGKNREIRRLLARIGHKVLRLRRVAIGPLRLGDLPPGAYRELSSHEIGALRSSEAVTVEIARPAKSVDPGAPSRPRRERGVRGSGGVFRPRRGKGRLQTGRQQTGRPAVGKSAKSGGGTRLRVRQTEGGSQGDLRSGSRRGRKVAPARGCTERPVGHSGELPE